LGEEAKAGKEKMNKNHDHPGRLIAVEGLDGSGKSTQVYLLKRWMEMQGLKVFFTEWNSSALVKEATRKGKKRQFLTPTTFSLVHATDFADRHERQILPLMRAGYIVLADRYMYTAFARDITRGCDPRWVRNLYSFAVVPDIAFFFDTPLAVSLDRILCGRPKLKYFEAGMDLNLADNETDSFKIFQGRIYAEYKKMVEPEGFMVMDGMLPVEKQQAMVRKFVEQRIDLPSFRWSGKQ
jgi:dTMP kinase